MNTKLRISKLMKTAGYDLWTLARNMEVTHTELAAIQMGEMEPSLTVTSKLNDLLYQLRLCPDCVSVPMPLGGCLECHCGWSACG